MSFSQSPDYSQVTDYSRSSLRSPKDSAAKPSSDSTTPDADRRESSLEATARHILASRRITRVDQRLLLQLSAKEAISQRDKQLINQVYGGLQQGRIRVVD